MANERETPTKIYEKWSVKPTKTEEADKKAQNINPLAGHKVSHEDHDYEKIEKLGTETLPEVIADQFNIHSHNNGIRYYESGSTPEVKAGKKKGK